MRSEFVAGNWKMNMDRASARSLVEDVVAEAGSFSGRRVGVFPPFTLLADVVRWADGSPLIVGAQDCHVESNGAYTGEVSAEMIADVGGTHVILGHSERRRDFGEDEPLLARKLAAALRAGLEPILCVGETIEERDAGRTLEIVQGHVAGALSSFDAAALEHLTIAYEPVWAIGTGHTATPAQAVEVHTAIRAAVATLFGDTFANALCIQYGGSVNPGNAEELLSEPEIDGALVGGASLKSDSFLAIARASITERESR